MKDGTSLADFSFSRPRRQLRRQTAIKTATRATTNVNINGNVNFIVNVNVTVTVDVDVDDNDDNDNDNDNNIDIDIDNKNTSLGKKYVRTSVAWRAPCRRPHHEHELVEDAVVSVPVLEIVHREPAVGGGKRLEEIVVRIRRTARDDVWRHSAATLQFRVSRFSLSGRSARQRSRSDYSPIGHARKTYMAESSLTSRLYSTLAFLFLFFQP